MKNIVLLGGSNSVMVNGLQKGLKEYANVTNLALGATTSIQNLYELKREKNQEAIQNADLIVTESNINDIDNNGLYPERLSLEIMFKRLQYYYGALYNFSKPICVIILPFWVANYKIINNMHKFLANYYGFNTVDVENYYKLNHLVEFGIRFKHHQLAVVSRNVGKEIAKNIDIFKISKKSLDINMPEFKIVTPENMQRNGNFKIFNPNNSMYNEIVYRLEKGNSLSFNDCDGYEIIGMHSWHMDINGVRFRIKFAETLKQCGVICIKNKNNCIVKPTATFNNVCDIQNEFILTNDTIAKFNNENLKYTEMSISSPDAVKHDYFDLIAFFLCKPNPKMKLFDLSVIPTDKDIEIDKDIDRSYLIPNIVFFKDSMEFIDEYIGHLYPNITKHIDNVLTPQIINKVKEQLSQTKINPQKEPTSTIDLEKQITAKIKNHLSYKLGEALIRANKNWYKGGYIKFIFEVIKIKKEHKNRR